MVNSNPHGVNVVSKATGPMGPQGFVNGLCEEGLGLFVKESASGFELNVEKLSSE